VTALRLLYVDSQIEFSCLLSSSYRPVQLPQRCGIYLACVKQIGLSGRYTSAANLGNSIGKTPSIYILISIGDPFPRVTRLPHDPATASLTGKKTFYPPTFRSLLTNIERPSTPLFSCRYLWFSSLIAHPYYFRVSLSHCHPKNIAYVPSLFFSVICI